MFFKEFRIKDEHTPGKERKVIVAAVLGEKKFDDPILKEKEGKRELFYTAMDYTAVPHFNKDVYKETSEKHLQSTLEMYDLVPLPDDLPFMESEFQKQISRAYMKNKVQKQYLAHQMGEIEKRQGELIENLVSQEPSELLRK